MKIVMGASPMEPEKADKRYWAVSVIRAYGFIQIIGIVVSAFVFGRPMVAQWLIEAFRMSFEVADALAIVLSLVVGVCAGFGTTALLFAFAMLLDDMHAVRAYLRDMRITGQYYDE